MFLQIGKKEDANLVQITKWPEISDDNELHDSLKHSSWVEILFDGAVNYSAKWIKKLTYVSSVSWYVICELVVLFMNS